MGLKANLQVHLYLVHTQTLQIPVSVLENYGMQLCTANFLCICLLAELLVLQLDADAIAM